MQSVLDALRAERAFERTDPRISGTGRQVFVAALAVGPKFKHRGARNKWN